MATGGGDESHAGGAQSGLKDRVMEILGRHGRDTGGSGLNPMLNREL